MARRGQRCKHFNLLRSKDLQQRCQGLWRVALGLLPQPVVQGHLEPLWGAIRAVLYLPFDVVYQVPADYIADALLRKLLALVADVHGFSPVTAVSAPRDQDL